MQFQFCAALLAALSFVRRRRTHATQAPLRGSLFVNSTRCDPTQTLQSHCPVTAQEFEDAFKCFLQFEFDKICCKNLLNTHVRCDRET